MAAWLASRIPTPESSSCSSGTATGVIDIVLGSGVRTPTEFANTGFSEEEPAFAHW